MDLGEKIIDCNNEEHLVGFKITENDVEYIITIERRIFRKENNNYIEWFENNTDKEVFKILKDIVEYPESLDVIY